jgi:hypothetical protein
MSDSDEPTMTLDEFRRLTFAPSEALALLAAHMSRDNARADLIGRLETGLLNAFAEDLVTVEDGTRNHRQLIGLASGFWRMVGLQATSALWSNGACTAYYTVHHQAEDDEARAFGVRFLKAEIQKMLSAYPDAVKTAAQAPAAIAAPLKSAGGAPSKSFWDDLLIEMARQIHFGELQPKRKADLTRAMLDWIAANGFDASEASVKLRSRKLFDAMCSDG